MQSSFFALIISKWQLSKELSLEVNMHEKLRDSLPPIQTFVFCIVDRLAWVFSIRL